jgi:hypothetical protein
MTAFQFHADLVDPAELVPAIMAATGEHDVRLLRGWRGCDRETGKPIDDEETGVVNVEWLRRKGRFSLDVDAHGANLAPRETSARFSRAVAKALGRPVLFSDCALSSFTCFSAEPDGSIWAQTLVFGDDDVMDLGACDGGDPRHRYPRLVLGPDEPLPERPPGSSESWRLGDPTCATAGAGDLCTVFYTPCPKLRRVDSTPDEVAPPTRRGGRSP